MWPDRILNYWNMFFTGAYRWTVVMVSALHITHLRATVPGPLQDVCLMETFHAQCPDDHVIVMKEAIYGRMRNGRCAPIGSGHLGCSTDVVRYFDGECSGRQECQVKVPNDHLFALNVCPQGFTPYLEAAYSCLSVLSHHRSCGRDGLVIVTSPSNGTIASSSVFTSRSGSSLCPWVIEAKPGQRINVTLVDFGLAPGASTVEGFRATCHKYATLSETLVPSPTTICSGTQRERNIYLSKSHRLEIIFVDSRGAEIQPSFLFNYSFVGCPNPTLNGNQLIERSPEKAVLQCDTSGQKSHLFCDGVRWNAAPQNCTQTQETPHSFWGEAASDWSSTQALVLISLIGLVVGTVIGLVLLFCIVILMKRRRNRKERPRSIFQESTNQPTSDKYLYEEKLDSVPETTGRVEYNTYERRASKGGRYAHAWSPDNRDVIIMENVPERTLPENAVQKADNAPASPDSLENSEHAYHIYERPL